MDKGNRHSKDLFGWPFWLGVIAVPVAIMLYFYYIFPGRNIGLLQPIPFSHRIHAGVKQINCRFCHPFADRSKNAGIPALEKCFFCHRTIIPTHPQILKVKVHLDERRPIRWMQVYWVPDFVKFDHRPHVRWAHLDCDVCHGAVETMDRLKPVQFKMGFCIDCHVERKAQVDCWLACHR